MNINNLNNHKEKINKKKNHFQNQMNNKNQIYYKKNKIQENTAFNLLKGMIFNQNNKMINSKIIYKINQMIVY